MVLFFILSYTNYQFFLKNTTQKIYCWRKINIMAENYSKAAFQRGTIHIDEDEKNIKVIAEKLINDCIKQEK